MADKKKIPKTELCSVSESSVARQKRSTRTRKKVSDETKQLINNDNTIVSEIQEGEDEVSVVLNDPDVPFPKRGKEHTKKLRVSIGHGKEKTFADFESIEEAAQDLGINPCVIRYALQRSGVWQGMTFKFI